MYDSLAVAAITLYLFGHSQVIDIPFTSVVTSCNDEKFLSPSRIALCVYEGNAYSKERRQSVLQRHVTVTVANIAEVLPDIYRAYTKEWCGIKSDTFETAPFFCVCPV